MDAETRMAAAHIAMQLYVRGTRTEEEIKGERPFGRTTLARALDELVKRDYVSKAADAYRLNPKYREDISELFPIN